MSMMRIVRMVRMMCVWGEISEDRLYYSVISQMRSMMGL